MRGLGIGGEIALLSLPRLTGKSAAKRVIKGLVASGDIVLDSFQGIMRDWTVAHADNPKVVKWLARHPKPDEFGLDELAWAFLRMKDPDREPSRFWKNVWNVVKVVGVVRKLFGAP